MRLFAAAVAVVALPTAAHARPITAGIGLGVSHSEADADAEANDTVGLWGRIGFGKRVSGQLEVAKIKGDADAYAPSNMRTLTALLVVDLKDSGPWMPVLFAGIGLDRESTTYNGFAGPVEESTQGHHIEGGLGLEYRASSGITIGIDLRLGGRSINNDASDQPLNGVEDGGGTPPPTPRGVAPCGGGDHPDSIARLPPPSHLSEGEYRSARLTLGIRF